jgi:hypothetical protein
MEAPKPNETQSPKIPIFEGLPEDVKKELMDAIEKQDVSELEKQVMSDLMHLLPDLIGRTKEDAIAKGIEGLLDRQKLKMLSLLFPDEDRELALYMIIGKIFEFEWMTDYVDFLLELRCSRLGWRASQITDIAKETKKEQRGILGFLGKIFKRKEKPPLGEVEAIE